MTTTRKVESIMPDTGQPDDTYEPRNDRASVAIIVAGILIGVVTLAHNPTHPVGWFAIIVAVAALGYWGRE